MKDTRAFVREQRAQCRHSTHKPGMDTCALARGCCAERRARAPLCDRQWHLCTHGQPQRELCS
eukprot:9864353-Alexandrium_andersonii.AAC.1